MIPGLNFFTCLICSSNSSKCTPIFATTLDVFKMSYSVNPSVIESPTITAPVNFSFRLRSPAPSSPSFFQAVRFFSQSPQYLLFLLREYIPVLPMCPLSYKKSPRTPCTISTMTSAAARTHTARTIFLLFSVLFSSFILFPHYNTHFILQIKITQDNNTFLD